MRVSDIMTTPVITVEIDERVQTAVGTMLDHRVGSVVVTDPGLQGILTRSDILRAAYHTRQPFTDLAVTDVMSHEVITTTDSTTVATALQTMAEHNIKKLPIVDGVNLVGIVTMTDIARHLPDRVTEVRQTLDRQDDWTG